MRSASKSLTALVVKRLGRLLKHLYQDQVIETSWYVLLDPDLKPLQKRPIGIEIKEKPSGKWVQLLWEGTGTTIDPVSTGNPEEGIV